MNPRLRNDCSWIAAGRLLSLVKHLLREEEHRDFFEEALAICKELLADYDAKKAHQAKRLGGPVNERTEQT